MPNGKGLAQSLLISSREAFGTATPLNKITAPGWLQYLMLNNKPRVISDIIDDGSGYIRNVKIRYRQRGTPGKSVTTDDCSVQARPLFMEYIVPSTSFRALGLAFEDDMIAQYERDALAIKDVGQGGKVTQVMMDMWDAVVEQANGLFGDINNDLLAYQAANFGRNFTTGSNAAKTVNFPLSTANNPLNQGMTMVMSDAIANEMRMQGVTIVGSGLITNYYLQQAAKGTDQSGLNTAGLALPKFYHDNYAQAAWGENNFGLFEKDAVQFVNVCRFRGVKGGERGQSFFGTLRIPVMDSLGQASLGDFEFDFQLIFRDCPSEVQIGPYVEGVNEPIRLNRGWNMILMSSYQSINIPNDSYATTDRLYLNNGCYKYSATNA